MACCRQAPSHYLSQCWPRSMFQWVNTRCEAPDGFKHCQKNHLWWNLNESQSGLCFPFQQQTEPKPVGLLTWLLQRAHSQKANLHHKSVSMSAKHLVTECVEKVILAECLKEGSNWITVWMLEHHNWSEPIPYFIMSWFPMFMVPFVAHDIFQSMGNLIIKIRLWWGRLFVMILMPIRVR